MAAVRDLKTEDFKKHNLADYCCSFDVLVAVTGLASSLYYQSNNKKDDAFCLQTLSSYAPIRKRPSLPIQDIIPKKKRSNRYRNHKDDPFCFQTLSSSAPNNNNPQDFKGLSLPIRKRPSLPIEDADEVITKKKRIKQYEASTIGDLGLIHYLHPPIHHLLPTEFKDSIVSFNQGLDIGQEILVIQKPLTATDISPHQNRFSIPLNQVLNNTFLNEDEIDILSSREESGKKVKTLEVNLIDPMRKMKWSVKLARRVMYKPDKKVNAKSNESANLKRKEGISRGGGGASISYVINGPWAKIVESNKLKVGDVMQLWGVRVQGSLWFLLVKLQD